MQNADRAKFLAVRDLLVLLASGVGEGSKALVDNSKTELGTLAVKEGDVSVTFEMSSTVSKNGVEVPGLGVRTVQPFSQLPVLLPLPGVGQNGATPTSQFFGVTQQNESVTNRATVTLKIVAVAPTPPASASGPADQPAGGKTDTIAGGGLPWDVATTAEAIRKGIVALRQRLAEMTVGRAEKKVVLDELGKIEALVEKGDITQALEALKKFAETHRGLFGGGGPAGGAASA